MPNYRYGYKPLNRDADIYDDATRETPRGRKYPAGRPIAVQAGTPLPNGYQRVTRAQLESLFGRAYYGHAGRGVIRELQAELRLAELTAAVD